MMVMQRIKARTTSFRRPYNVVVTDMIFSKVFVYCFFVEDIIDEEEFEDDDYIENQGECFIHLSFIIRILKARIFFTG